MFTEDELVMLGKTADALTAYLGQPILAEVDTAENGHEWVAFAVPLSDQGSPADEDVRIQMGGPDARWVGNKGGLTPAPEDVYDCRFLWGIQLCPEEGRRYTKLDHEGEECGWSDHLVELLPFVIADDEPAGEQDEAEDDDEPSFVPERRAR
ncbi:hypothetical protein V8Z80_14890 [Orrella sp. JC864]|uniref:hypothetical protein n=1 Tax=Orrella sp. JC864 TaxID=3120298 RepID=UPI00300BBB33